MLPAVLSATAALVAFLLIYIQPAITTHLLPGTGGHPYLWHGAQVVFLLLLTSGYWLAGRIGQWFSLRTIGTFLIALALLAAVPMSWIPIEADSVAAAVLYVALATGPGFLALAMGSVGVQVAFVRLFESRDPYWLYAASNAGSLVAAWSYVFLIEPNLDLSAQVAVWKAVVAGLFLAIGGLLIARNAPPQRATVSTEAAPGRLRLRWVLAGLCPVALSLSSTSYLTLHFGAQPTVWLGPFAAYLTTLALAFTETGSRILQRMSILTAPATVAGVALLISPPTTSIWLFAMYLVLVSILMASWNLRLASMRPAPGRLSTFYVHASLGGLAAAVIVSMAAPFLLNPTRFPGAIFQALRPIFATGAPEYFIFLLAGLILPVRRLSKAVTAVATVAAAVICIIRVGATSEVLHWSRSEFGQLVVTESATLRTITNGIITHGYQEVRCASGREPLTCVQPGSYYGKLAPVGATVASLRERTSALRMAVVGLGAGTMGAYCESGDTLVFYELDPRVQAVADAHFTFLARGRSRCDSVKVSIGDGRRLAQEAPAGSMDLIIMDAFSSDTVPVHLLTQEGLGSFARLLSENGAISVHVSNRYFDLVPVVGAGLRANGLYASAGIDPGAPGRFSSTWLVASRNEDIVDETAGRLRRAAIDVKTITGGVPWRDERHSLLAALR